MDEESPGPVKQPRWSILFMKAFLLSIFITLAFFSYGQIFSLTVKDAVNKQPLAGATVKVGTNTKRANEEGFVAFTGLPVGNIDVHISYAGYEPVDTSFTLPDTISHIIYLHPAKKDLENVTIISSTRSNQRIENSPLKVEVLGREEMDEENNIKPGNIASILGDVSGIQIQQSSAVSGNSNVRIQGLEGRYTQILRDGMPLFEGFSGGFGILQIPPLDLRQIELIKGSASTLYGGGAIGGLINLISKRPSMQQEAEITANRSTLKETNFNTYIAKRNNSIGYNFFGQFTDQGIVDVNKDGFSDVAKTTAVVLHPRIFFYSGDKFTMATGYTGSFETREGGDMQVIQREANGQHVYFEKNKLQRNTFDVQMQWSLPNSSRVEVKGLYSDFNRSIDNNQSYFKGDQQNYYTEAAFITSKGKLNWVSGLNLVGDKFKSLAGSRTRFGDFSNNTVGAFTQLTASFTPETILEAGLRDDYHNTYGNFFLPRLAFFHRFNDTWASRWGVGLGYKTPNILAPQTIDYPIQALWPFPPFIKSERSIGYNAEVNFKKELSEESSLFINQALFLTRLSDPIIAVEQSSSNVLFGNAGKNITSKGFDTYIKALIENWELYAGYTFTIAERNYRASNKFMPLTPRNRFAFVLAYDIEEEWRFGLEGSYTGQQHRFDYSLTPSYFFMAAVAARNFGDRVTLVLNCENLLDYRQSKEEPLFTGSVTNPEFVPLWSPIDGRVVNLSVKVNLVKKHK